MIRLIRHKYLVWLILVIVSVFFLTNTLNNKSARIGETAIEQDPILREIYQGWNTWLRKPKDYDASSSPHWWLLELGQSTPDGGFVEQGKESGAGWVAVGYMIDFYPVANAVFEAYLLENTRIEKSFWAWDNHISQSKSFFTLNVVERNLQDGNMQIMEHFYVLPEQVKWISKPGQVGERAQLWLDLQCREGKMRMVIEGGDYYRAIQLDAECD